ncbi:putative quinol monooxygenase [Marimonas arenosa]|uniref:Antibiotic biosynthesis monooxygenase n=1 Tax=Marimonas arenosa TaxID=1795305 RepID=A0AAE4B751_9RHOB|nr:putative quinol monooxygenase [Marimonas arenosa]MDQ2092014.1 antibiotic biosynthesis monooxygenase [Marimonas arenosa]
MAVVHVFAVITAKPGKREAVLAHFHENVPAVRAEEGCVEYQAVIDADDAGPFQSALGPDSFAVVEKWETMAALHAHAVSPHMKAYGDKVKDMLAERRIHILRDA